ncbi:hypothetical protein AB0K56_30045, partial [Nocardia farcinica]
GASGQPRASGTQGSAGVPSGAAAAAGRIGAARAATSGMRRADESMGDVAGDRWANRSPDLGRSTIPR